jgi:hypothetical protein
MSEENGSMSEEVERDADGAELQSAYFSQTLLPDYIEEHGLSWKVTYDDRGHFKIPHIEDEEIGCGTIAVYNYLNGVRKHLIKDAIDDLKRWKLDTDYPTKGVKYRCSAVLFIEKEGFHPLFEDTELCERYDLALLSTKGQSVTAARELVDYLCGPNCPLLVLHDFDAYGIRILKNLVTSNRRYQFRRGRVNYIDFGLRLADVKQWGLAAEGCPPPGLGGLDGWLEADEKEFLASGKRVELNAFTSPDLIKWIEAKLEEHGIEKVIPGEKILRDAFKRIWVSETVNSQLKDLIEKARKSVKKVKVPPDIYDKVEAILEESAETPWDQARDRDFLQAREADRPHRQPPPRHARRSR